MNSAAFPRADRLCDLRAMMFCICGALGLWTVPWATSGAADTQAPSSQQAEGLFTAAQSARGKVAYEKECMACHGKNLEGSSSVPLAGERFMTKWGQGKNTVDDLYYITKTQMPYGRGNSLPSKQYIDITAYILAINGYRAGAKELPDNSATLLTLKIASQNPTTRPAAPNRVASDTNANAQPSSSRPTQVELNSAAGATDDWLMSNHDYGGQRFVDLKQINRQNAASLKPVVRYQAGGSNSFHTNPVVHQGVMYITTTYSTAALDAVTLKRKWRYDRKPKGPEGWSQNRGVAVKDGRVIRGTHDGCLL